MKIWIDEIDLTICVWLALSVQLSEQIRSFETTNAVLNTMLLLVFIREASGVLPWIEVSLEIQRKSIEATRARNCQLNGRFYSSVFS